MVKNNHMNWKEKRNVGWYAIDKLTAIEKSIKYFNDKAKISSDNQLIDLRNYYITKNETTHLKYKELNEYNAIYNELKLRGFL
jgi:hypothetical protein